MNDHVTQWLEPFYDGELNNSRTQQVENHLSVCNLCREKLEKLQMLSTLLAEAPNVRTSISPDAFVSQVNLKLPRNPKRTNWQRAYQTTWRLAPIGILASWAFLQAAIITSGILALGLYIFPNGNPIAGLLQSQSDFSLPNYSTSSGIIPIEAGRTGLDFLTSGSPLGGFPTITMGLTIVVGLFYMSWLASWWIQKSNGSGKQTVLTKQMERSKS